MDRAIRATLTKYMHKLTALEIISLKNKGKETDYLNNDLLDKYYFIQIRNVYKKIKPSCYG